MSRVFGRVLYQRGRGRGRGGMWGRDQDGGASYLGSRMAEEGDKMA